MNKMERFFNIEKYGELKIDRVIFEAAYPVLFTCVNDRQDLFLCVCCQNNRAGTKWLLSKSSSSDIIRMLRDELTIRDALLQNSDCRITITSDNRGVHVEFDNAEVWAADSIYLPKTGEYLDADPGEFDDDIGYYLSMEKDKILASTYQMISSVTDYFTDSAWAVLEDMEYAVVERDTFFTPSEIVKNLYTIEHIHFSDAKSILARYLSYCLNLQEQYTVNLANVESEVYYEIDNENPYDLEAA